MRRLVIENSRLDTARAGIATLGTKQVQVPGFMPAVNGGEDLELLLSRPIEVPELTGIVIPLHASHNVMRRAQRMDLQYDLVIGGEKWSAFRNKTPILVDPVSELFYITRPSLRRRIAQLPGAPSDFFSKMYRATTDHHVSTWRRAVTDGSYLAALEWISRYEVGMGADIVLPITPFVDGQSQVGLDLTIEANSIACEFLSVTNHLPGLYFALNYPVFRHEGLVSRLIAGIRKMVLEKAPYIIAVRIRGLPQAERDDDTPLWVSLLGFLIAVGGIATEFGVPFVLLNAGTYGFASLGDGVDFFSEPLNGNLGDPPAEDPITGERKFRPGLAAGKVYHPEYKINLSRKDYAATIAAEGAYPAVHHSTPPDLRVSDVDFRKQAKHYRVAARCEEARKFKAAIQIGEPRSLAEEFARSRARNAERLIANPL